MLRFCIATDYKLIPTPYNASPTRCKALPTRYKALPTRCKALPTRYIALPTRYKAPPTRYNESPTRYNVFPTQYKCDSFSLQRQVPYSFYFISAPLGEYLSYFFKTVTFCCFSFLAFSIRKGSPSGVAMVMFFISQRLTNLSDPARAADMSRFSNLKSSM